MANWTREELILVCAELRSNNWVAYRTNSDEAAELSAVLNATDFVPMDERGEDFRSPNSVQRKMYDFVTLLPGYAGKPTKGGQATRDVLDDFLQDPEAMAAEAVQLRAHIDAGTTSQAAASESLDVDWESDDLVPEQDFEAFEGNPQLVQHFKRERNQTIRKHKIAAVKAAGQAIACEVCAFNFGDFYGDIGHDYIEVHHVLPLHASGPTITQLEDLALLCSNCHRMIHRGQQWLTPTELRDLLISLKG